MTKAESLIIPNTVNQIAVYEGSDPRLLADVLRADAIEVLGVEGVQDQFALEKYKISSSDVADLVESIFQQVSESLKTPPVFTSSKIVVLNLTDILTVKKTESARSQAIKNFIGNLLVTAKNMSSSTYFWVTTSVKWNKKDWESLGCDIEVKSFLSDDSSVSLKDRALGRIRNAGKRIQLKDLEEWINSNEEEFCFWDQLDQVLLQIGENVEITRIHLEPFLQFEFDRNMFAFSNALGKRDVSKVLSLIHQYIELEGESVYVVLGKLITFFTQLTTAARILERSKVDSARYSLDKNGICNYSKNVLDSCVSGARPGVETDLVKKHPYALKSILTSASRFKIEELKRWTRQLSDFDKATKSSSVDVKYAFETLVVGLI